MNIAPVSFNFANPYNTKRAVFNSSNNTQPNISAYLQQDTVTFSAKSKPENKKTEKTGVTSMIDALEKSYLDSEERFIKTAAEFHQALERACSTLEEEGFSYDKDYNSKHPVKSLDAYIDKYARQGYVLDTIRGTVYWQNQHDIAGFKKFLKAMENEGYVIHIIKERNPVTGEIEKIPDLEIRQKGITKEDLAILGSVYKNADISEPRSSTYADYQMRFVKKKKAGNHNPPLEVILLYGHNYAAAKEKESKYVYNITRTLNKLHVDLKKEYPEKSPGRSIANKADIIKTRLREDISKPLFTNAYNADLKIREPKLPVIIPQMYGEVLNNSLCVIEKKIPMYYKEMRKSLKDDECIKNIITKSTGYKIREDKKISPEEIAATRARLYELIPKYEAEDIGTIATVRMMLDKTIQKFGEK